MFRICALTTFWVFSVQLKAQQDQFLVYDATSCKYETQNIENVSVGSDILDRDNYLETWKFPKDSLIASTANSRFSDMQKVERILHNEQFPASAVLDDLGRQRLCQLSFRLQSHLDPLGPCAPRSAA